MSDGKTAATSDSRVLVVDDDRNMVNFIRDLLHTVPYEVIACGSGADALAAIEKQPVDLVLLDVVMPAIDGFAIAKLMRERFGANNFVPIILISGLTSPEKKIEGLAIADDFITKPFNQDELLARIRVMLRIRQLQRDLFVLEREQKLARTQLYRSARLASIGTFASGVAHELNNPLTAVLGFSASLLERLRREESIDKDELEQYLSIINSETVRCSDIVENLSQFAREGEVQIRDFGLAECVEGAVKLVNSLAARKNMAIRKTVPPDLRVRADLRKLQQAIVYVVTNSLDFCKGGGTIDIEAKEGSRVVKLCISDNGPGIAPDMIAKVFDPFFTTKEVGQGMGMGLAMCYVIMEECNGAIDVTSDKGKGTTVIFEIPSATIQGAGS
jgi:two-component system, NtrC family, sensor kinase